LGKHTYSKFSSGNNPTIQTQDGYGLSADFVQAGYVNGSQIIGGDIYSSNFASGIRGTHINLNNGTFEIGGNKLTYNGSTLSVRGNITVGGSGNTNGTVNVLNANGQPVVTLDNNGITLKNGATIDYSKISNPPSIPAKASDLSDYSTLITNTSIRTIEVTAQNLTAGHVAAENITGKTISGKTISGGTINGATITGNTSITQQSDDNSEKVVIDGGEINVSSTNSKYNTKLDNGSINVSNGETDADHSHTDIYPGILQLNAGEENCWIAAQLGRVLEISCKEINWIDTPMRGVLSDDVYAYGVPYTGRATISVNSASTGEKKGKALYILNGLVCSTYP
jgi:hypothetical protein